MLSTCNDDDVDEHENDNVDNENPFPFHLISTRPKLSFIQKDKNGQTVYRIRPLVEYAAFFGDPWQRVY